MGLRFLEMDRLWPVWAWTEDQGRVQVKTGLSSEDAEWADADMSRKLREESGLEIEVYVT